MSFWTVVLILVVVGPAIRWSMQGNRRGWRAAWLDDPRLGARYDELASELDRRGALIEQLESRVAELENRLDFAERMLTSPRLRPTELAETGPDRSP